MPVFKKINGIFQSGTQNVFYTNGYNLTKDICFCLLKGEEGVHEVLNILKEELKITMQLCGMVLYFFKMCFCTSTYLTKRPVTGYQIFYRIENPFSAFNRNIFYFPLWNFLKHSNHV